MILFLQKLRLKNDFKDRSLDGVGTNTDFKKIQEKPIGE